MRTDLEAAFGDPYDAHNPLGADRVVVSDERDECLAEAESLLDHTGFAAEFVPVELGGRFESVPALVDALRPVFARDAALGLGYGITTFMAGLNVYAAGDVAQRKTVADMILAGDKISVAYHELDHGNDLTSNECTATPWGSGYLLHGGKQVINNIGRAHCAVVFARTDEGAGPRAHSLFLVPLDDPMIDRETRYRTSGLRGCLLGGVEFDGVELTNSDLIGRRGGAVEVALRSFQVSRCVAASAALGPVDESLFLVLKFALERRLYGRRLADLPHARAVLADAYTDLLIADAMVRQAATALHVVPASAGALCAATKYLVPRILEDVMRSLSTLLGARFYLRRGPYAMFGKHYRDIPAVAIGHAGGVSCQLAILPQLKRLTRLDNAGSTDSMERVNPLPPLDFDRLAVIGRAPDPALVRLRATLDPAGAVDRPIARALSDLCLAAQRLDPAYAGVAAPQSVLRLAENYALLTAAAAVAAVADRDAPWSRRAWQRLAGRLTKERPPALRDDAIITELVEHAENGRGFDLSARQVARRLA